MKSTLLLTSNLAIFLLSLGASPAFAGGDPDPAKVAARCTARITQIGEVASARISEGCDAVVARIEEALGNGDVEGARDAARRGIRRLRRAAANAGDEIAETTRRCVRVLRRLGAEESVIQGVLSSAREAQGAIESSVRACVAAIQAALGSGRE